jgi:hypothetical protein
MNFNISTLQTYKDEPPDGIKHHHAYERIIARKEFLK